MNQVEELVKVVEAAQADKGNVVIVTGKPRSDKSKARRRNKDFTNPQRP